ncbi:glycosyltransferase family 2 protein [Mariniflexile ostreae]|uniref:Glycosyltransferase family 2 protein n=1 Tax=Mariniflexile ostreae TaxID=1520892 RepID=A0ABV5FG12_9FLAO
MFPFFSVVIPLYNKQHYIVATLNSVINQTFKDFEIIIINDGSTDNSLQKVNAFQDSRISIYSQKNQGLSAARNAGIKKVKSNYIALLDADDLWVHDYLEYMHFMITNYKDACIFATRNTLWFKKNLPELNTSVNFNRNDIALIFNYFELAKNLFSYSSIVFHKSVFNTIGYFDENINFGEEEDFSIRCFSKYKLVYSKKQKVFYLQHPNQMTKPNKIIKRVIPDYEINLQNNTNLYLKKYIDFVHFKWVVLFKMERNYNQVALYKNKILVKNLTAIQKIKYYLPTDLFYISKTFYNWLFKRFIQ